MTLNPGPAKRPLPPLGSRQAPVRRVAVVALRQLAEGIRNGVRLCWKPGAARPKAGRVLVNSNTAWLQRPLLPRNHFCKWFLGNDNEVLDFVWNLRVVSETHPRSGPKAPPGARVCWKPGAVPPSPDRCGSESECCLVSEVNHDFLSACSFSRMAMRVFKTVSGLSEMLSIPCSTRNWANSG
jgi:hypothetical protein